MTPSCNARTHIIASIAPAAPNVWPITDFVDETARSYACAPKTSLIARVSAIDQLRPLTDRVRPRRARRDDGVVRTLQTERDRQLPAGRVDEDVREEVRRHAVSAATAPYLLLLEDPVDAADRRAEDDADAHRVEPVESRIGHRLTRGAEGEEDVPLELAHLLRRGDLRRVEVLHLGRHPDGELARVEGADPVDSALPGDGSLPGRLGVVAERRHGTEAGNGDSSHGGPRLDTVSRRQVTKGQISGKIPVDS